MSDNNSRNPTNSGPRIGRIGAWGDSSASSSRASSSSGPRLATLRDLASSSAPEPAPRPMHESDDEDDDEEHEKREGETWYAGGERSGVSIQNPNTAQGDVPGGNLVRDLLRRATEGGMAAPPSPEPQGAAFRGGGHTLGGEDVESRFIPDPSAPEQEEQAVIRYLTFWRNGFTIGDGELMRYDDPANAEILKIINSGRAPPSLLGVEVGQAVELRVNRRTDTDFAAPRYKAFAGAGHRLGSPVPGEPVVSASSSSMPGSFPASGTLLTASISAGPSTSTERESLTTRFEVDQTQPTTSVQIRLADGTRLVCRMNLTHRIEDIRNFINASRPENNARPYTIMTTFPNKVLEDETQTIKEAGLVNSVVVQRWV